MYGLQKDGVSISGLGRLLILLLEMWKKSTANHYRARETARILTLQCPQNEPPKFGDAMILNVPDATLKFIKTFRSNLRDCSVGAFHEDVVSVIWGVRAEGTAKKRLPIV